MIANLHIGALSRVIFFPILKSMCFMTALIGCDLNDERKPPASPTKLNSTTLPNNTPGPPRNCLLIVIDTTCAAHCSAWGYERTTTPNLDELAKAGVRFSNAYSQAPSTVPSVWSYMSGQYPIPSSSEGLLMLEDSTDTVAEVFQRGDFNTFGFSENPFISESLGFTQGFDNFTSLPPLLDGKYERRNQNATRRLLEKAQVSIENSSDAPWFAYIHLFRPHSPYLAPEPYGSHFMTPQDKSLASPELEHALMSGESTPELNSDIDALSSGLDYVIASYDGNLAYVDGLIGGFIANLDAKAALDNSVVIITSDHGESMMQHGRIGHGIDLYEEFIHVPLVVWAPSIPGFEPGVVDEKVSVLDLFKTLVEIFELESPDQLDGASWLPLLKGQRQDRTTKIFAQNLVGDKVSVRKGDLKMIANVDVQTRELVSQEVYDLRTDPAETTNIMTNGKAFDELHDALQKYVSSWPDPPVVESDVLSEEQTEQLEAVGYLN